MSETNQLQVRISPAVKKKLRALAKSEGRTMSNMVRLLVEEAVLLRMKSDMCPACFGTGTYVNPSGSAAIKCRRCNGTGKRS
jgi:hypothetical protein